MTPKLLAAGAAAVAVAGSAAVGATALATSIPAVPGQVQLAVSGAPMPLNPAAAVPTVDQLNTVLYGLADPNVPFAAKGNLVEGGIGRIEARTADALMLKAVANGQLPLTFSVSNIAAAGPGAATASVTASGPTMPPTTSSISFVDQGGWKLSRASATTVLAMFSA